MEDFVFEATLTDQSMRAKADKEGSKLRLIEDLPEATDNYVRKTEDKVIAQVTLGEMDAEDRKEEGEEVDTLRFSAEVKFVITYDRDDQGTSTTGKTVWTIELPRVFSREELTWILANIGTMIRVEVAPDAGPLFRRAPKPSSRPRVEITTSHSQTRAA